MYNLIKNKQNFIQHSKEDIETIVNGFTHNKIPDYQMAAWLMAVYLNGMTNIETAHYTQSLTNSGKRIKFENLNNPIIDKHSTGGVGDKVSLILGPILAACNCYIPMIVGRGLGHTGGTLDKLESIKGYNGFLTVDRFKKTVQEIGISIIGQTDEICPADKKIYALRDITGTIESNPLICGSILSKKIAEGIDYLVMDIKVGNGAFMKDKKEAIILGDYLKNVAGKFGIKMKYSITDMNQPLGNQAGLICEVIESIETLKGNGPNDLLKVVSHLANECLTLAGIDNGMQKIEKVINNGKAYEKFEKMIIAHGGDISSIKLNPSITKIIKAKKEGYLNFKNTKGLGMSIIELGGGRKKIDDIVDSNAGFRLIKKHGSYVNKDDEIAEIFCSDNNKIEKGILTFEKSIQIINQLPNKYKLIY
ncbi:MAG: thymidine phosphorylase [Candidatus Neomarinimicrobiota bacterium]